MSIDFRQACAACGKSFSEAEWDNRHSHHEPGCPLSRREDDEDDCDLGERNDAEDTPMGFLGCDCDLNYHSECCPVCAAAYAGVEIPGAWESRAG